MNRNDMRSVVYLIIALIAFYFLMDDFIGKNKISNWVNNFIGGFGGNLVPPAKTDTQTQTAGGGATATAPPHNQRQHQVKIYRQIRCL